MVKKLFVSGIFFLSIFFFSSSVNAQQKEVDRYVCLDSIQCSAPNSNCSITGPNGAHRVRLTTSNKAGEKPLAGKPTFIVECFSTGSNRICTTGNKDLDQQLYARDVQAMLNKTYGQYRFEGLFAPDGKTQVQYPIVASNVGTVGPFEWQSFTEKGANRKFYAVNRYIPTDVAAGTDGGIQQGTFSLENAEKKCIGINWDPYGKVFDSKSLEPIPGAQVRLMEKSGASYIEFPGPSTNFTGFIENPQTTIEDGAFSFIVPNGTYRLQATASNYTMLNETTEINPLYKNIYSDVYDGEDIIQFNKIQHRDIAMESASGPKTYPVKLMGYSQEINKLTGKVTVEGSVSHPFTKIKAYSLRPDPTDATGQRTVRSKLISSVQANQQGNFKVEIDPAQMEKTEFFGQLELEKVELVAGLPKSDASLVSRVVKTLLEKLQVKAQETTTVRFEPIPNYLEGFAYDNAGKTIPNATVGVYLTFSDKPYYETKADAKGYYKISSEYLPFMSYRVRYSSPLGTRIEVPTSKYITQNAKYITSNNVDISEYKDSEGNTPVSNDIKNSTGSGGVSGSPQAGGSAAAGTGLPTAVAGSTQSNILLVIVIVLVLLGVAGALLGIYVYTKNKTAPPTV